MRILHIINVRWFNATAWYAYRLAEAGIALGDEAVIAGLPSSPVVNMAKDAGIGVFEADFNSNNILTIIKTIKRTASFIKDFKPDLIVCHRGEMFWWFSLYSRFFSKGWKLIRVRGDIRPPTTDFFSKYMHNKCAWRVITSAEIIRDKFLTKLKTPPYKVSTVYGGVNTDIFKPNKDLRLATRKSLGYGNDDFVVAIVGRFDPVKGHEVFLKACSLVYKNGMKNLKVLLVGFPENITVSQIETLIKENGLEDVAFITGRRNDVAALMNASDLGVVASLGSEAICRVAMEFMACGVPVVASDAGVLPEMFSDLNLYPMKDYELLAQRIKRHNNYIKIYDSKDFYRQFISACSIDR